MKNDFLSIDFLVLINETLLITAKFKIKYEQSEIMKKLRFAFHKDNENFNINE